MHASAGVLAIMVVLAMMTAWFASRSHQTGQEPVLPILLSSAAEPAPLDEAVKGVMDAIDDPLLLVLRNQVVHVNPAAMTMLGDHVIGEDVRLAIRHPAATPYLIENAIDEGPIELIGLGDRDRRWELVINKLTSGRRLIHLRDRTGAHAVEKVRVDFVANASHELRTPLATLLGFIETMQEQTMEEDSATRARFLRIMRGEAKRMEQLVDDLMSLSRIEADKFSLPKTVLALPPLALSARADIESTHPALQVIIEVEKDVADVTGDPVQLTQLLHNLIGNSIKYGRVGTPVRVRIGNADNQMVRMSVTDEGEGIAPEHLPRLTERFYRVDAGRSKKMGGTGLGLAIVKHIVERHRGRLNIKSELGIGTTVTVLLPAAVSSNGHRVATEGELERS
jgi:two-component system phosphate regulon sensor histidine kinase PhoR